jgi:hypothetical protein
MDTRTQGRFCHSCEKLVHDFTSMTDEELINYLQSAPKNICGRFRDDQLEQPITKQNTIFQKLKLKPVSVAALFVAKLLGTTPSNAQDSTFTFNEDNEKEIKFKKYYTDSVIFHATGNIENHKGKSLNFARVIIKAGEKNVITTRTDSLGNFEVNIPCKNGNEQIDILIKHCRYKNILIGNYVPDGEPLYLKMRKNKKAKGRRMGRISTGYFTFLLLLGLGALVPANAKAQKPDLVTISTQDSTVFNIKGIVLTKSNEAIRFARVEIVVNGEVVKKITANEKGKFEVNITVKNGDGEKIGLNFDHFRFKKLTIENYTPSTELLQVKLKRDKKNYKRGYTIGCPSF